MLHSLVNLTGVECTESLPGNQGTVGTSDGGCGPHCTSSWACLSRDHDLNKEKKVGGDASPKHSPTLASLCMRTRGRREFENEEAFLSARGVRKKRKKPRYTIYCCWVGIPPGL